MQGAPATAGSKILENYRPPYDATAVAKLAAAGAVLLGKLNCDEFAMGSSNENSAYGPVHNPRALDRRSRRFQRRFGCRSRCQHGGGYARHRYRRIDSPACVLLRRRGPVADLWPRVALRIDCVRFVAGSRGSVHAHGGGRSHSSARSRWSRSDGRDQRTSAGAELCSGIGHASERFAHRHSG